MKLDRNNTAGNMNKVMIKILLLERCVKIDTTMENVVTINPGSKLKQNRKTVLRTKLS